MAIASHSFKLVDRKSLTHDVFELTFTSDTATPPKPGQYIMFQLPSGLKRSYSIAYASGNRFTFVIKRMDYDGSGSKEVCDAEVGSSTPGIGPIGHFVLTDGDVPRLFIGTGTGFAPLYFQVRALEERGFKAKSEFVFGVRNDADMFYQNELARLSQTHDSFAFTQYLSQGSAEGTKKGYVSDMLTPEYVANFQEFYICGSPVMVKGVRELLTGLGIAKENVKFEQY